MKKKLSLLLAVLTLGALAAPKTDKLELNYFEFDPELNTSVQTSRDKVCLNGIWQFQTLPLKAERGRIPQSGWEEIKVPSYFSKPELFEHPADRAKAHRAWYRHEFEIPAAWKGKQIRLHFGAVMAWCQLYINGQKVPTPEVYGTVPVNVDITKYVSPGKKAVAELEVQDVTYYSNNKRILENVEHTMNHGGIWQDVYLLALPEVYTGNVHIQTSVRKKEITVNSVIANDSKTSAELTVSQEVLDSDGKTVLTLPPAKLSLAPGERKKTSQKASWKNPKLWDVDQPNLYLLKTSVSGKNLKKDSKLTRFGFREFRIDGPNFKLNEKRVYLKGCWDNPLDPLYPEFMNRSYANLVFKALRDMNTNTLRWHSGKNFGLPLFYSMADEKGVMTVAGVERTGNGCANSLTSDAALPIISLAVLRDRNHPSIILWSGNNEAFSFIYWEGTLRDGPPEFEQVETYDFLMTVDKTVKKYDRTRPLYYHGNYDLFGYADIINVHYPVYVVDLLNGANFFSNLRKSCPDIFKRNKPIVVGEFWYVPHLREFSEKYCGDSVFRDMDASVKAGADYYEHLILGWRRDRIAGMLSFMNWFTFRHPIKQHQTGVPAKLSYKTWEGPYMKPTYMSRPNMNNGVEPGTPVYLPSPIFHAHKFAYNTLVAYFPYPGTNAKGASELEKQITIINDYNSAKELTLKMEFVADGKIMSQASVNATANADSVKELNFKLKMPSVAKPLKGALRLSAIESGKTISTKDYPLTVYPADFTKVPTFKNSFQLYDTTGKTERIFKKAGIGYVKISAPEKANPKLPLVLGAYLPKSELAKMEPELTAFLRAGGHLLCFEQTGKGGSDCEAFVQSAGHPVFDGIVDGKLGWWQGKDSYVTKGAYSKPVKGSFRILADCDVKRTPLFELFTGSGSAVYNQLDCTGKYGEDPVATRLFHNLLRYIDKPAQTPAFRPAFLLTGSDITEKAFKDAGLNAKPVKSVSEAAPGSILILSTNSLKKDNAAALRTFASNGGTVILFPQNDAAALGALTGNQVGFTNRYTGEFYSVFLLEKEGDSRAWGVNSLDFMDWSLWQTWHLPTKWSGEWTPLVELTEGPNAFLYASLYPPLPGKKADKYQMLRAEADPAFALSSRKQLGAAVLAGKIGRGGMLLIQMPIDKHSAKSPDARRVMIQLLTEAGVPATEVQNSAKINLDDYVFLDLAPFATVPFKYTSATGGWSDQGAINDLAEFPTGLNFFSGIPVNVIDPAKNGGKGCIGLASTSLAKNSKHHDKYPKSVSGIKVNAKAAKLHILQSASYAPPGKEMANIKVNYQDGSSVKIPLVTGKNVADWWYPKEVPEASIGWVGKNASCTTLGVYLYPWSNPHPEKTISTLDIISAAGEPIPLIAGISAEKWETNAVVGLNETLNFRGLAVTPVRIESHGTFSAIFTVADNGKVIAKEFGVRENQPRKLTSGHRNIRIDLTGFANGKAKLNIRIDGK